MGWSQYDIGCCCDGGTCPDNGQKIAPYTDDFSSDTSGDYEDFTSFSIGSGVATNTSNAPSAVMLFDIPVNPTELDVSVDFTITPTGIYTLSDSQVILAVSSVECRLELGRYLRATSLGSNLDDYGASSINNGTLRMYFTDDGGGDYTLVREVYFGASLVLTHTGSTTSGTGWADLLTSYTSDADGCSVGIGFASRVINPFATITYTFDNFTVDWS